MNDASLEVACAKTSLRAVLGCFWPIRAEYSFVFLAHGPLVIVGVLGDNPLPVLGTHRPVWSLTGITQIRESTEVHVKL